MKVIVAYLLAVVLGKNNCPSADDLKKILDSVKGKDITLLIASGQEKLAPVFSAAAGAAGAVTFATSGGDGGGAVPAADKAKKEEKLEEEESDDDMGVSLFD